MYQTINEIRIDARRYQAFRWLLCASETEQEPLRDVLGPLLDDSAEPTPAQLDEVLDALADHLAALAAP